MKTSPPITPPVVASVLGFLWMVEGLGEELEELPDWTLVEVGVFFEDIEGPARPGGASRWIK